MRLCLFSFRRLYSTSKPLCERLKLDLSMVAPASIKICVLGCGRKGTPKTVLVDTAITRYLINCGEGTQRLITERRSKAARINHAFFTRMSWDAVSGLLGIALTAKAAGVKKLTVHGHPSISQLMSLTRHFADCDTTDIVVSDILEKPFVDTAFKVKSFTLRKQALNDYEPNMKRSKPETMDDPLSTVYCYYFQTFLSRPKLNKQKCIELGVPPFVLESPIVRQWIEGNDVTLNDGRVITAQEATFPPESSPNFMIIDCPDLDFLNAYLSHTELFETLKSTKSDDKLINGVSLIIHLIPQGMFHSKEYQELVQKLEDASSVTLPNEFDQSRSKVQHLVIDGSDCLPVAYGMYSQSVVLNKLYDPHVYPLLYELVNSDWKMKREKILSQPIDPFTPVVFAEPQLQYQIRPWNGFNK